MMKEGVVVVGAGGHAKVIIEILHAMGEQVDYCVSSLDSPNTWVGVSILKGDENLQKLRENGYSKAFIAIGSNSIRQCIAEVAIQAGYQLVNAISPNAVVSPSAHLGIGIAVMAGAVINAGCVIEDLAIINTGATVDHDCRIGRGAHIAPQCGLAGNVVVGTNSFLGVGCKVIPGIKIGERATIGAGGVVILDIPSGATAIGVPVKIVKH